MEAQDILQEELIRALHGLIERIEKNGIRGADWSQDWEVIEVPPTGDAREYRPGPHTHIRLALHWAHIKEEDRLAGEKSEWGKRYGQNIVTGFHSGGSIA